MAMYPGSTYGKPNGVVTFVDPFSTIIGGVVSGGVVIFPRLLNGPTVPLITSRALSSYTLLGTKLVTLCVPIPSMVAKCIHSSSFD